MKKILFLFSFLFVLFSCETDEKNLEEAKLSLEISREELEKQIVEHLIQQDNEQG